ncbi:LOW QUALITY PROTEIN: hypothetical protein IFM47457_06573 [Aspergillus lentulus]|nr:LOW QUALITY PROTEIN: hypothetical protein IFM47457_06573 [Aspergillus lentulus]
MSTSSLCVVPLVLPTKRAVVKCVWFWAFVCAVDESSPQWCAQCVQGCLMQWSKMLGLESPPFSVRVFSLITGSIVTNIMSHGNLSLLEMSHYRKGIEEI